jgi:hypothetical protein
VAAESPGCSRRYSLRFAAAIPICGHGFSGSGVASQTFTVPSHPAFVKQGFWRLVEA